MTQPYREPAPMPSIVPSLKRVRVRRHFPAWVNLATTGTCMLASGELIDIYEATSHHHGLLTAAIGVLGLLGVGAFVTTGSLTYSTWEWQDVSERQGDDTKGGIG